MKKIAILHSGDLDKVSPGGISQYIEKLIKFNEKNEITLFGTVDKCSEYEIGKVYKREINEKQYKFIPISSNAKRPLSIYYFINILKYFNFLNKYDVIYAQRMEYALPFTFSKQKKKVIMAIHGSGKYSYLYWGKVIGSIYNLFERIAINTSEKVIVLLNREEFGVPYYKKKFRGKENKFIYGKVPIDIEVFKKLNKFDLRQKLNFDKDDNIIIYFGRLDNNPKRVLLLPNIVSVLNKRFNNIKCVIIGDGGDKTNLLNKINELNLHENFIVKSKLPHGNELINYVNISDVSLILSTFEGICMSALESLACGVPVIATDVGDVKEYINNGENGFVIKNGNDEEVIDEMVKVCSDIFQNNNIKINELYRNFNGSQVMKELTEIFESICGGK